jgi:ABC-type transport system involved in multi-copper enzyme maturation permease subunit
VSSTTPVATTLDFSATPPIPLSRLIRVEFRKLLDTRSGRWLLILQALLILIAVGGTTIVLAVNDETIVVMDLTVIAGLVMAVLLPVMGILAITTEWSQRTHMVTFTLEPRRGRVVAAKTVAILLAGVASIVVAVAIGYLAGGAAALFGAQVDLHADWELLAGFLVAQLLGLLSGFAFGALLLNSPAAIVLYVAYNTVIPGVLAAAAGLSWFAHIHPWVDFVAAQQPLTSGPTPADIGFAAVEWGHFVVSGLIWLVLPLTLGALRIMRAEVK